ncbi:hypothetical protein J437_LFUL017013 [Ladona fulva]|uniref:Cortactin n=1 Tax=Ladona fulva TaxID=123851 RepID=A0A8K0P809_LADFU|nr:hypothetical protein J437_LFUL017013 [Ladona fulva]
MGQLLWSPDYSKGFGGRFGVQTDRQDNSAVGWDHVEKIEKHASQKDYAVGFGGKFGVQADRQDKSAVGWDHHDPLQKHESQTDHKKVKNYFN